MSRLREGFTTGTAATAAALAALAHILGCPPCDTVRVPLPPFVDGQARDWLRIPVRHVRRLYKKPHGACAVVQKDAGDDPDVTDKALIMAHVYKEALIYSCHSERSEESRIKGKDWILHFVQNDKAGLSDKAGLGDKTDAISIDGGRGVGRVTLPGLPVRVGEAAINPVPQAQLRFALRHFADAHGYSGPLRLVISVPLGARLARHTLNPRLGIVGGISILGTQGTVRPYSHDAWRVAVVQAIEVAAASGCDTLCLCTGRRSENLLRARYPGLPAQACVQSADFVHAACEAAGRLPFIHLVWGGFFGKLVKIAQGHAHTHAHTAALDFALLDTWRIEAGVSASVVHCVTASHALDILLADERGTDAIVAVTRRAAQVLTKFAGRRVTVHLFHLNGRELARV